MAEHPINILERYWNYTEFRPLQEDIINAVLEGNDTFALMPTGGGKSMCFQIPALIKEGICIVVSPLVALMKDQVNNLKDKGIKAIALTSGIPYSELDSLLDNCIYGNYKFLYISPERLQQDLVRERIQLMNVNLIAVDEAHCISQWGHDFRPAYQNINSLRELLPSAHVIALTASATPKVVQDCIKALDFIDEKVFKQSFARPNIAYMVFDTEDKYYKVESILKKNPESSIIYVRSRKLTADISQYLNQKGFGSIHFHGGLSNDQKTEHLRQWLSNEKQVMVATSAFGMGIDKPDVKTVIHFNLPESIESYFQEAGRAGRNGQKAYAVILKNNSDEQRLKGQFLQVLPSVDFVKQVYRKLCNYFQISYGEGEYTVHEFNFNQFCKTYTFNTHIAYNAMQILDRTSVIALSKQFNKRSSVQFIVSSQQVFDYLSRHSNFETMIKTILRSYGGIFDQEVSVNLNIIASKANTTSDSVANMLKQLEKDTIVSLKLYQTDAQVTFIEPREDDKTINRIALIIEQQNKLKTNQINAMLQFVNTDSICKSVQLLSYFGEKNIKPCGICSICIQEKKTATTDIKTIITHIIKHLEQGAQSSRQIAEALNLNEEYIISALKLMVENSMITITNTNTYKLKHT